MWQNSLRTSQDEVCPADGIQTEQGLLRAGCRDKTCGLVALLGLVRSKKNVNTHTNLQRP